MSIAQGVAADAYRGKRLKWSGWVKTVNASGSDVGLWMRVDAPNATTAFDNMSNRPLRGTQDWQQVSVVLDVAQNAIGIALGCVLSQQGTLLIDDAKRTPVNLASTKPACAAGLQQIYSVIDSSQAAYTAASSSTKYESVKHDARLVQQFEAMASIANANQSSNSRDQSMAENIGAVFDPTAEAAYFYNAQFPNDFDLLLFVNPTTASTLLPFTL